MLSLAFGLSLKTPLVACVVIKPSLNRIASIASSIRPAWSLSQAWLIAKSAAAIWPLRSNPDHRGDGMLPLFLISNLIYWAWLACKSSITRKSSHKIQRLLYCL
jgi:hypothetical protein